MHQRYNIYLEYEHDHVTHNGSNVNETCGHQTLLLGAAVPLQTAEIQPSQAT